MRTILVRYTVKPDQATINEQLVRAVYDELHETSPEGLRYATFRADDGVTFMHLAVNETANPTSPLLQIRAFGRFQEGIASRCASAPQTTDLAVVGAYRVLDG